MSGLFDQNITYQPSSADHFSPKRIILTKGWGDTNIQIQRAKAICQAYPKAELVDMSNLPHNRVDLQQPDLLTTHYEGKQTLVLGIHKSALRFSEEENNTCPNCWHFSPYGFCPYDCKYCYLAGTPGVKYSPTVKIFLNLEQILDQIDKAATNLTEPTAFYLGKLEDALALDNLTGYSRIMVPFFAQQKYAKMTLLTKCGNIQNLLDLEHNGNTILSWSLNPPAVSKHFETNVPSISQRIEAIKMCADGRTADNPIQHLKCQNVKLDRRHDRRALSLEEIEKLISKTKNYPKRNRMTGKERAMLYTLAVSTGFRANELASLTWSSLDLSDSKASVTVEAAYSKRRREDVIPLRKETASIFADWKKQLQATGKAKLFPKFDPTRGARMLKKDLEQAGIEYVDDAGRYADFHALRHTFITNLTQSGVNVRVAQSLARHSTVTLTMDRYSHVTSYNERAAIDALPDLTGTPDDKEACQQVELKTGTDNLPITPKKTDTKTAHKTAQIAYFDNQSMSEVVNIVNENDEIRENCKPFDSNKIGTDKQPLSVPFSNGGGGIRTPGPFRVNGFQDRRNQPLCHSSSIKYWK